MPQGHATGFERDLFEDTITVDCEDQGIQSNPEYECRVIYGEGGIDDETGEALSETDEGVVKGIVLKEDVPFRSTAEDHIAVIGGSTYRARSNTDMTFYFEHADCWTDVVGRLVCEENKV